jgi:G3E family GTPase
MTSSQRFHSIPTNIITGQLGVGKTTAIKHLLSHKPAQERWAVLVNEFGEVGIDGQLIARQPGGGEAEGVYVREVPGGCMCCAAGLPMQIALNQLIRRARPHRLLIEPSGLGHPREILDTLRSDYNRELIDLRATLALVDARVLNNLDRLGDSLHTQLQVADLVLASKSDLYNGNELGKLARLLRLSYPQASNALRPIRHGELKLAWLDQTNRFAQQPAPNIVAGHHHAPLDPEHELPPCGYLRIDSRGDAGASSGWLIGPEHVFDFHAIYSLLHEAEPARIKAILITNRGIFSFNKAAEVMSCEELDEVDHSRLEVIGEDPDSWSGLEAKLLDCRIAR